MNRVLQLPLGSSAPPVVESYTLGDVLICKANRGKLLEVEHLIKALHADHGCSALHGAAASGQLDVVQWMGTHGSVNWSATDHDDQTALHYAAFYGHLEVVQFLVESGVPLDAPDKFGRLAHCSAASTATWTWSRICWRNAPVPLRLMRSTRYAPNLYGGTCLHWAASKGRKEVIQYLCMKGIDIHITSYDNKTAYQIAKDKHKQKCVQFLKSWYETSQKFVHAAEEGDDEEIARIIADINGSYPLRFMRDKNGKNAMHWAAEFGHLSTLKLLIEHFTLWTDVDKTVYNWLKFFKMEEYAQNFEKDGFDTLRGVATIDEDDLIDMDVKKGHRRVVLSHIEELRNQLMMLDENAEVAGMEPLSSPTLSMLPPITKQSSMSSIVSASGEAIPHRTERRGSITAPPPPTDV
ncbi:hypothetical protein PInf_012788 [Phytophthora infestans]|nr:hypothetical protein PInf_012788 [Phytophthora infestans]